MSTLTRRQFIQASVGLVVAFYLPFGKKAFAQSNNQPVDPNAFVNISPDNTVTVFIKHIEIGQGAFTGLATLVAEELDADWAQMRAEHAPTNSEIYLNFAFGIQGVGGSSGLSNSYEQMRKVGATAKALLVAAAAQKWQVPTSDISVKKGQVIHNSSGQSLTFGELANAANEQPAPKDVVLKSRDEFTLIGTDLPKLDTSIKTNGKAVFTQDLAFDNMRYAVVAHPPLFGGKVASFESKAALKVKGVIDVQQVPSGVAVIAKNTYAAIKGRDALNIKWDQQKAETRSSTQMFSDFKEAVQQVGTVAASKGNASQSLSAADEVFEFEYEFPYLAHTPMETLDAVVRINESGGVDVWMGSQLQTVDQGTIAAVLGNKPNKVNLMTQLGGGTFGRRAQPDSGFAAEAAHVAKTQPTGVPVKLIWTREDDIQGGRYRPLTVHKITAGLNQDGAISGWKQVIATQSIMAGSPFAQMIENGIDPTSIEGARDECYSLPDHELSLHTMQSKVPVLWWRSVGHTHTGYALETMMDFLLEKANKDPIEGRLAMMTEHPRDAAVLKAVKQLADKSAAVADNAKRGVAVHRSFGSYVAQIAEVTKSATGMPKVTKVWCAIDCGIAVNPNIVKAQIEGGIGFGLGAILHEELSLKTGGYVTQSNFDDYHPLRIAEMPEVEVVILQTDNPPTGVGEPGLPPIGPAVANGWRRLTGQMITKLPMEKTITALSQEV